MTTRDLGLTLAGGGNRSFYQLGLLERWGPALRDRIAVVAGCSAGAGVATLWLAGRSQQATAYWRERRAHVTQNFDWSELWRGRNPAPHGPIYRDTLLHGYGEGGLERIQALPFPVLVLAAALPRWSPTAVGVMVGLTAYNIEKRIRRGLMHPTFGRALGFRSVVVDARTCASPEELADLIIASSSTPPFTPLGRFLGQRLLDGGMVDNVPADATESIPGVLRNVVLLTRASYPVGVLGLKGHRLYLAPSGPVPVHRWDYTRPEAVDATIALGRKDADTHQAILESFIGPLRDMPAPE